MSDRKWTVYMHVAPSGKKYVGITSRALKLRWKSGGGYSYNVHFSNAIKRYGWDNFKHIVLICGVSEACAKEIEKTIIQCLDLTNTKNGYNQTLGGEGSLGYRHTKESLQKISKRSAGANNPNYGKRASAETRKKIGDAQIGRKLSEQTKEKMRISHIGKNAGTANAKARAVLCLNTGVVFNTAVDAVKAMGATCTNICLCCQGKRQSAGKHAVTGERLKWAYAEKQCIGGENIC